MTKRSTITRAAAFELLNDMISEDCLQIEVCHAGQGRADANVGAGSSDYYFHDFEKVPTVEEIIEVCNTLVAMDIADNRA